MSTIGLIAYAFDSREKFKELRKIGSYIGIKPILFEEENGEVYKVKNMEFARFVMVEFIFIMTRNLRESLGSV